MSFNHEIENVVHVVEGVGVGILVVGGVAVFAHSSYLYISNKRRADAYQYFRRHLGRVILVGLEVLIIGDIINTVIVDHSAKSVAALGVVVIVRILLSWSLAVELDGVWPWRKRELEDAIKREGG